MAANPLIVTLALNPEAEEYFTEMRSRHFPAERNFLRAHVTLFHQLPPHEPAIADVLAVIAANQPEMPVAVTGLLNMGRGVAFSLKSAQLEALHRQLQLQWQPFLIPQDRQKLRPHITVQNKATAEQARQLLQELEAAFVPFSVTGTGLLLWEYLGGPWQLVRQFPFQKPAR